MIDKKFLEAENQMAEPTSKLLKEYVNLLTRAERAERMCERLIKAGNSLCDLKPFIPPDIDIKFSNWKSIVAEWRKEANDEEASNLIALYGSSCWHQQTEEKRSDRAKLEVYIANLEAENAELKAYRDGYHPKEKLPEITKGGYSSEYVTVLCDYSENTKPVFVEACYVNGYDYWKPYSGTGDISRVYRWWPRQKFDRVCAYPLPGGDE